MTLWFLSFQNLDMIVGHVYCKVLFHYTVPVWKSTLLVIGIWNIIYWGPHLSPQPTCMLFLLYHLWVLVHLNYRDIKQLSHKGGRGGVTGPPGPPPSYAPDVEKTISPLLVYVLNKTWNLAFSCPGRVVMAKTMYKKAWCMCTIVALPIHLNLLPF